MVTTRRLLRDRSFRERVLGAYQHRCAICAVQLGLIEAAHIIPAAIETSTDNTSNGIAFCPTHHKAYDTALITVDDEYRVVVSVKLVEGLRQERLDGGFEAFCAALLPLIVLPPETALRPRVEFLREGRRIRQWQG